MMKCNSMKSVILNYVDGSLTTEAAAQVSAHVDRCTYCQRMLERETQLKKSMALLPVVEPSAGFFDRVFNELEEQSPPSRRNGFWAGFATAAAAGLAAWLVIIPAQMPEQNQQQPALAIISATVNEVKEVRISFDAPYEYKKVTLSLSLPDHVELDGFPGEKQLSWETEISQGKNVLTLPLIMRKQGKGVLQATVSDAGKSKVFSVQLNSLPEKHTGELRSTIKV